MGSIIKFLIRLFPGLFSIFAGVIKFGGQFVNSKIDIANIKDLHSPDMVFLFYHNSGPYIYFIAISQILGGVLLIYKKTSLIGAIMCLVIFTNVMLLNYYFNFSNLLVVFMFLLNLSFIITLVFEYKKLKTIFL